jgi:hypothetical protein
LLQHQPLLQKSFRFSISLCISSRFDSTAAAAAFASAAFELSLAVILFQ